MHNWARRDIFPPSGSRVRSDGCRNKSTLHENVGSSDEKTVVAAWYAYPNVYPTVYHFINRFTDKDMFLDIYVFILSIGRREKHTNNVRLPSRARWYELFVKYKFLAGTTTPEGMDLISIWGKSEVSSRTYEYPHECGVWLLGMWGNLRSDWLRSYWALSWEPFTCWSKILYGVTLAKLMIRCHARHLLLLFMSDRL